MGVQVQPGVVRPDLLEVGEVEVALAAAQLHHPGARLDPAGHLLEPFAEGFLAVGGLHEQGVEQGEAVE